MKLLPRAEYFADLVARLNRAGKGDRVIIATMAFVARGPDIHHLMLALAGAAQRGADVRLVLDAFSFMMDYDANRVGPLFYSTSLERPRRGPFAEAKKALQDLEEAGGKYVILNPPRRSLTNPFAGRSHIKFAVLNDRVYIGGCNLDVGVQLDVMVAWSDNALGDYLANFTDGLFAKHHVRAVLGDKDFVHPVRPGVDLMCDVGVAGQSLIFDRAMELIDSAKEHVLVTHQYYPNSTTIRHLLAAHNRGVKVKIVYNHPNRHPGPHKILHHSVTAAHRLIVPASLFEHVVKKRGVYLHAKVLATESAVLIGSHNYVTAGVRLGTAEMTLDIRNAEMARRAEALVWSMVG